MSALCQKRTLAELLDHLVGAGEQRGGNVEPEHPRGDEVDDELELGRLHDRQVRGFLPLVDAAGVHALGF